ncbi:hypothetical protein V8B55DRAFT_1437007 [Mucor lusitanicus]
MASSAKEHNGTFKGPKSFQQTKNHGLLSYLVAPASTRALCLPHQPLSPQHVDHFLHKVARPFLKGTILVDITQVYGRQKEFIVALTIYCEGNTRLWAVSEHMRRDNSRRKVSEKSQESNYINDADWAKLDNSMSTAPTTSDTDIDNDDEGSVSIQN